MTEWISVEDRLPEEGEWVLTFSRKVNIKMWENNIFYDGDVNYYCPIGVENGVTHWMPLPAPPDNK